MEDKKEVTIDRVFDAPVDLVWRAWIDQELVKQWWGPRMVDIPVCEVDPKVGGKLNIVMEAGKEMGPVAGTKWPMEGEFTEVVENQKLVFKATAKDEDRGLFDTLNTVIFEPDGGKTKLHIHIEVTRTTVEAENAIKGMEMGWNQTIDKLGEFLAKEQNV
jgi:uncharacterized protein YndB with AHSA1/START domain